MRCELAKAESQNSPNTNGNRHTIARLLLALLLPTALPLALHSIHTPRSIVSLTCAISHFTLSLCTSIASNLSASLLLLLRLCVCSHHCTRPGYSLLHHCAAQPCSTARRLPPLPPPPLRLLPRHLSPPPCCPLLACPAVSAMFCSRWIALLPAPSPLSERSSNNKSA